MRHRKHGRCAIKRLYAFCLLFFLEQRAAALAQAHAHLASLRVLGRGLKGGVPAVGGRWVSGVSGGGADTSGLAQFTSVRWWWCFFWSRGLRRWRKQMCKICGLGGWYRGVVGWGTGESHLAVLRGRGGPRGVHVGPCSHRQRLLALASARSRGEWGGGEAREIGGVGG